MGIMGIMGIMIWHMFRDSLTLGNVGGIIES